MFWFLHFKVKHILTNVSTHLILFTKLELNYIWYCIKLLDRCWDIMYLTTWLIIKIIGNENIPWTVVIMRWIPKNNNIKKDRQLWKHSHNMDDWIYMITYGMHIFTSHIVHVRCKPVPKATDTLNTLFNILSTVYTKKVFSSIF